MQVSPSSILFEVMLFLSLSQKAHHTNSTDFSFKVFRPSMSDLGLVPQCYNKSGSIQLESVQVDLKCQSPKMKSELKVIRSKDKVKHSKVRDESKYSSNSVQNSKHKC